MDPSSIRRYLTSRLDEQPGTKIQYGHPSPRFWRSSAPSLAEVARLRSRERPLFLYLHVPFCPQTDPPACGFCLFAREDYKGHGAVLRYLETMRRELEILGGAFGGQELACVYFGGGTPNVLKPEDYPRVMDWVRSIFPLAPGAEVTLEGVPQLFTEERTAAMAAAGVTRVSVGAQQLKPELLQHSGREHTAAQVFASIERAHRHGMVANVDLICGWFGQAEGDLEEDLARLAPHAPESVVVHPLTLAGDSHFADRKELLPPTAETRRAFLRGRRWLEANRYHGTSYTDYMRCDPPRGPAEVQYLRFYRDVLRYDRIGVGYGANSLLAGSLEAPGWTFRNLADLGPYDARVNAGELPVAEGFGYAAEDLRLLYVLKGLEGTPFLRRDAYARDVGGDLEADFHHHWAALRELGWLEVEADGTYRLAGDGVFYTPLVQRCISNDRNDELRAGARPEPRRLMVMSPA